MMMIMRKCNSQIVDNIQRQIRWTRKRILCIGILFIIINSIISPCRCEDTPQKRSIDLSSSWRPMHFQQAVPPSHLISISSLDNANRIQLFQIAQYNAQILQKLKDMEAALKRNNIDIQSGKPTNAVPTSATPTVLPEYSLNQMAQLRSNHNALRNSIDPAHLMGEHPPYSAVPATLKQSPQFMHNPSFLKPPFNIHSAASNVVYSAVPHGHNAGPSHAVPKSNSFGTGKPVYYSKYPEAKPQYYSSTPKVPYLIQQTPPHFSALPSYYRTPTIYRDAPMMTTPPHPVLNKIQAHLNTFVGKLPPQRHHTTGLLPINGQQHVKIGNASIPMHIISSLSIFGNALQQIRDTTQKEKILNHLLRNITTTASSFIPPAVASTVASSLNAFSTLPPPDAYFKPMHFKPIPVTMPPQSTNKSPAGELESQPTMAIPQRPVYPPVPDIITQGPPVTAGNHHYGHGSVKQLPFLPTIPAQDKPLRVKNISPLQDANRYAYKTNTPPAVSHAYDNQLFTVTPGKPISYNLGPTTENSFHIFDNHLNAEFHKIKQQFNYEPGKKQNLRIIGEALTTPKAVDYSQDHSFFTIDDAVTGVPHHYMNDRRKPQKQHRFKPDAVSPTQQSVDIFSTLSNLEHFRTVTTTSLPDPTTTTTTVSPPTTVPELEEFVYPTQEPTIAPRPRTKLRRKKPRPHHFHNLEQEMDTATSNIVTNSWEYTRHRHRVRGRPSADIFQETPTESNVIENSVTEQSPSHRQSDRVKFPSRHRFIEGTTPEPRTRGTSPQPERENQVEEIATTTSPLLSIATTTQSSFNDEYTTEEHLRHRTRFRYKPRTRPTTTTTTTESPSSVEVNFEESTDNPLMDEEKMILSLMNNVAKGGQSTEETIITTTLGPSQSRVKPIMRFDTKNRPRFSVKDYRNRQNSTTTTKSSETTTPSNNVRSRNKLTKEELELRATKRLSPTTSKPRSTLPQIPRRKPIGNRLDINKPKTSSEPSTSVDTTPSTTQSVQTTPMTIKLRNSFRTRDKTRFGANPLDKVNANENDIPLTDDDELVRSESNHYGKEVQPEEKKLPVENLTEKSHETSIMKIAKDDHSYRSHVHRSSTTPSPLAELMNTIDNESHLLQRVSDLTVTSGQNFVNSVNTKHVSRKIPNYFTIATEDPILPIEAFFPNVINKE